MRHTPYDGSSKPFTIGLKPLDPDHWIDWDARVPAYLAEKRALLREKWDVVFRADPDTLGAQDEVLDLVTEHMITCHPGAVQATGAGADRILTCAALNECFSVRDWEHAPLALAALLVPEDLVLMRKTGEGWCLIAACLCFPSHWSLADKFGKPLEGVHAPVPDVNESLGVRINRIFDYLRAEAPVWRQNVSLCMDDGLHHPEVSGAGIPPGDDPRAAVLRIEHQTLRKLPRSGDILFTIKVVTDPLRALEAHPNGAVLAGGLRDQLAAMTPDQLRYKKLDTSLPAVLAYLEGVRDSAR